MLPSELPENNEPTQESSSGLPNPEPPATPLPSNVATREELLAVAESVKALAAGLQQGFATRSTSPEPELVDPTPEELLTDLTNGRADKLKTLLDNQRRRFVKDYIEPLHMGGLQRFSAITKQQVLADASMPHYKKFEKQIEQKLQGVPLEQRSTYDAHKLAYNLTLAENMDVLMREERERILREKPGDDGSIPSGGRRDNLPAGVPTVAELLGAEADRDMRNKGWTPDDLIKRLPGYKSFGKTWAEAAPLIKAQIEQGGGNA